LKELEAIIESTKYDLDRTKQEKEDIMKHYEQVPSPLLVF
jgi:hypothetical protein